MVLYIVFSNVKKGFTLIQISGHRLIAKPFHTLAKYMQKHVFHFIFQWGKKKNNTTKKPIYLFSIEYIFNIFE